MYIGVIVILALILGIPFLMTYVFRPKKKKHIFSNEQMQEIENRISQHVYKIGKEVYAELTSPAQQQQLNSNIKKIAKEVYDEFRPIREEPAIPLACKYPTQNEAVNHRITKPVPLDCKKKSLNIKVKLKKSKKAYAKRKRTKRTKPKN